MRGGDNNTVKPMALFGGTFDPVHYGHLRCADEVRQKLGLEIMYLLPAGTPALRAAPLASTCQRLQMLRLALQEFPFLSLDERETLRSGTSYMVDTLKEIRMESPSRPVLLLIGQDAANHLHVWFQWERLFSFAHLVIMTRPGSDAAYRPDVAHQLQQRTVSDARALFRGKAGRVLKLEVTSVDVSSTIIKKFIRQGRSTKSMLPGSVLDYINENQLYLPA